MYEPSWSTVIEGEIVLYAAVPELVPLILNIDRLVKSSLFLVTIPVGIGSSHIGTN